MGGAAVSGVAIARRRIRPVAGRHRRRHGHRRVADGRPCRRMPIGRGASGAGMPATGMPDRRHAGRAASAGAGRPPGGHRSSDRAGIGRAGRIRVGRAGRSGGIVGRRVRPCRRPRSGTASLEPRSGMRSDGIRRAVRLLARRAAARPGRGAGRPATRRSRRSGPGRRRRAPPGRAPAAPTGSPVSVASTRSRNASTSSTLYPRRSARRRNR